VPPRRRTLAEELAATRALGQTRELAAARISRGKREMLAQKPPSQAHAKYDAVMATHTARVEGLINKHVIERLPILGSGDELDVQALQRGLIHLHADMTRLAQSVRRSAGAAFDRATAHAGKEAARILNVNIPYTKDDQERAREAFIERQVRLLQRMADAQVKAIEKAILTYPEGTSLRKRIEKQLYVTRNRGKLIARNEVWKLAESEMRRWAELAGSPGGIYHTRRDELVRPTHRAHDGEYYAWGQEPSTLGEPNCRCRMVPVSAATLR
jgi:hypothetical protein